MDDALEPGLVLLSNPLDEIPEACCLLVLVAPLEVEALALADWRGTRAGLLRTNVFVSLAIPIASFGVVASNTSGGRYRNLARCQLFHAPKAVAQPSSAPATQLMNCPSISSSRAIRLTETKLVQTIDLILVPDLLSG